MSLKIVGDTACPSCRKNGHDKTGNHLILFNNGAAFCNRCSYREKPETFTKPTRSLTGAKSPEDIKKDIEWVKGNSKLGGVGLADRRLNSVTLQHYGVRVGLSFEDGKTPVCYYLPIHDESGLCGYKVKTFDKNMWIKGAGKNALFFGADVVPPKGGKNSKLFITEGQEDAMALYQTLVEFGDPKYKHRIAVVSLQNGAGAADKEMIRNKELIDAYRQVVLCFDMDDAGSKAVEKVLTVLPKEKVLVAKYQEKDANDMIKAGLAKDLYYNVVFHASPPKPEKIISGEALSLDDLMTPLKPGLDTPYPVLNEKLHGLRYGQGGGELTVICAGSGMGKTSLAREIAYDLNARHQKRIGNIYLEEQIRKTGQSYIALDNNVPVAALREDPSILSKEQFQKSRDKLISNGRCFFMQHWGSIDSRELVDHMYYMSKVDHCDFIILDHISLVVSGNDASSSEGERKDLDVLMTRLAAFCEESGTSIIAIVHLRRPQNGSFNDGTRISLSHLRGSAGIEQLCWNIIAVEGNQRGNNPNLRQLRILKNREWGDIGAADEVEYLPETGRLVSYVPKIGG